MDYTALEPARLFLAYLPLLPLLPLLVVAVAAIVDIGREAWAATVGGLHRPALAFVAVPVDRTIGESGGPLVRFLQEERAGRAVETARLKGDPIVALRASLALATGDYGRALGLAGAACRKGR